MIYQKLRELKERSGLSVQQIAEKSGVPASTISRILSGQTDRPNCQTLVDLVRAMGGSVDEIMDLHVEKSKEPEKPKDTETAKEPGKPKDPENRKDIDTIIQLYERAIANKNKTIKMLYIACAVLIVLLLIIVLYFCWDITHPNMGLIKY